VRPPGRSVFSPQTVPVACDDDKPASFRAPAERHVDSERAATAKVATSTFGRSAVTGAPALVHALAVRTATRCDWRNIHRRVAETTAKSYAKLANIDAVDKAIRGRAGRARMDRFADLRARGPVRANFLEYRCSVARAPAGVDRGGVEKTNAASSNAASALTKSMFCRMWLSIFIEHIRPQPFACSNLLTEDLDLSVDEQLRYRWRPRSTPVHSVAIRPTSTCFE
jgi:hypothetical protein